MVFGEKPKEMREPDKVQDYPSFANPRKMETPAQAHKVNSIVQSMYDDFNAHTTQGQETTNDTYRASSYRSQLVDNVKDICYDNWCNMSFEMYTNGMVEGGIYPLMKLGIDNVVGNIIGVGVDNKDSPSRFLHSYGSFVTTYYDVANEYQLSFFCFSTPPAQKWWVSLQMLVTKGD